MSQKRSIKLPQETITKLEQMNLVDQFLFNEVIKYQDAFEAVVSILLEKDIHLLSSAETEKEFLDFMEYIMHSTAECAERSASKRIGLIHQRVTEVKNSEMAGRKAEKNI